MITHGLHCLSPILWFESAERLESFKGDKWAAHTYSTRWESPSIHYAEAVGWNAADDKTKIVATLEERDRKGGAESWGSVPTQISVSSMSQRTEAITVRARITLGLGNKNITVRTHHDKEGLKPHLKRSNCIGCYLWILKVKCTRMSVLIYTYRLPPLQDFAFKLEYLSIRTV